MMIVKLTFDNDSFDGQDSYQFQVRTKKGKKKTNITPIVTDPDLVVLSLYDIPGEWINMAINVAYEDSKDVLVSLYTTESDVTRVNKISQKASNEYRAEVYEEKEAPYKDLIEEKQAEIADIDTQISALEEQKKAIRVAMTQSLPEEELAEYQTKLSTINSKIDGLNESKGDLQAEIAEAQAAIKELESTKDYYLGRQEGSVSVRTTKPDGDNQVVLKSTTKPNTRVVGEEETTTVPDGEIVVVDDTTTKKGSK